jgi:hypothetical protein
MDIFHGLDIGRAALGHDVHHLGVFIEEVNHVVGYDCAGYEEDGADTVES